MRFEISLDEVKMLIRQYKKLIEVQDALDRSTTLEISVFARGFHPLLTRLIEEHNQRLEIGITKRRIKV